MLPKWSLMKKSVVYEVLLWLLVPDENCTVSHSVMSPSYELVVEAFDAEPCADAGLVITRMDINNNMRKYLLLIRKVFSQI